MIYKETLVNGTYTQSIVASVPSTRIFGSDPGTAVVDAIGNVYFLGDVEAQVTGSPSSIYAYTLQPDGSYASSGPLQFPDPSSFVIYENCNFVRVDNVAVDGNGTLYFNGYIECTNAYNATTTYSALCKYASGISQPPVPVSTSQIKYTEAEYLPGPQLMVVDTRGNFYFLDNLGLLEESLLPSAFLPSINLANVTPYGVAVDAGGNILIAGSTPLTPTTSAPGVYKLDFADPPTLNFQPAANGVTSSDSPQSVSIVDVGTVPVALSSMSFPTDFPAAPTGNCTETTTLGIEASCLLSIDFTPVAPLGSNASDALTETVNLSYSANGSTSTSAITVTGTEILPPAPAPTFSVAAGSYTSIQSVALADSTAGATIYYTADGTAPTVSSSKYASPITVSAATETINAIAIAQGNSQSAVATATYTITSDFSVALSPAALTVQPGQSVTSMLTVAPQGGFASAVTFSCSGLPLGAACSFSPATVTPSGVAASTNLTVTTSAATPALRSSLSSLLSGSTLAVMVCCLNWKRKRRLSTLLLLLLSLGALTLATGCSGGGSNAAPPPITSTLTVTATSGALQHASTLSLTVN